ncbi:MAG: hydrogenase iron-sulfur subunit [Methanomassiliicoccales archaeon]
MKDNCIAAVRINQDLCSRCGVCYSLCPFDAVDHQPFGGIVEIDMQKCQVCGICSSACPVTAIEMAYYDYDDLLDTVRSAVRKAGTETLVMMCRGNSPSNNEVKDLLSANKLGTSRYIPIRVPCAGRIPTDFIFHALRSGVENIVSIQCQDKFCRMKEGAGIETRRLMLGNAVLQQLGYPENALTVVKYSRKAVWISKECVGCGKCSFICPYDAIQVGPFSSPTVIAENCVACGACQLVCPHQAIQVQGYEFDTVLRSYGNALKAMKAKRDAPAILVLSCQWSEYSALDYPEEMLKGKNAVIMEVPCFKGMDPLHVANAFRCGFDGVMAVVCAEKDCKLPKGRDSSERQVGVLQDYLRKEGLLERFHLHEHSPRCKGEFVDVFEEFHTKIATIPFTAASAQREARDDL